MKQYDIVLVLAYFRSALPYLCVIKYLGQRFRIGLVCADLDQANAEKNGKTQAQFIAECKALGADVLEGQCVETILLVVQQWPYSADDVARINANIRARRVVGLLALAMAGVAKHDEFLRQFSVEAVYTPCIRFTRFLLERRGAQAAYDGIEMRQVGLPYGRYPLFPDFRCDYLIASPTPFSFLTESDKHRYLENVLKLLGQIQASECVAYKSHNGMRLDYFTPSGYSLFGRLLAQLPGTWRAWRYLARSGMPGKVRIHFERLYTAFLHARVSRRVTPISDLTTNHEFALEAFLPGVGKGVIGGLSNTIWGTLFFRLPFFNCVDPGARDAEAKVEWLSKSSKHLLDLNLQFFGVRYCAGNLLGGDLGESVMTEADREGDLLRELAAAVQAQRGLQGAA